MGCESEGTRGSSSAKEQEREISGVGGGAEMELLFVDK
jgi:hypothetical protein